MEYMYIYAYSFFIIIVLYVDEMFSAMNKHLINLDNGGYNIGYDGTFYIQRIINILNI